DGAIHVSLPQAPRSGAGDSMNCGRDMGKVGIEQADAEFGRSEGVRVTTLPQAPSVLPSSHSPCEKRSSAGKCVGLVGLLLLLGSGCVPRSAEQVADRFVDLYFVEIDQKRVLPLTTGLARTKIEEELGLVEGIRRNYQPDQAKPSIFYTRQSGQ